MTRHFKHAITLQPHQIRMARSGLNITVRELAVLSEVNKATIVRIEAGYPVRESTLHTIRKTLEAHGAQFYICPETDEICVGIKMIEETQ